MNYTENNKLVAEFMGAEKRNGGFHFTERFSKVVSRSFTYNEKDFKFNSSWDWLMPVVEKIESLGFTFNMTGKSNYVFIGSDKVGFIQDKKSKIENVYFTVVEFIKWYNKNK